MFLDNPEFRKNLKLEFSATRFWMAAILFGLISLIAWSWTSELHNWQKMPLEFYKAQDLFGTLCGFGFIFTIIWGSYLTANNMTSEIQQKSWDFVRMSSLSPMKIIIGKLFGAPSVVWTVSLSCVLPWLLWSYSVMLPDYFGWHIIFSLGLSLVFWTILSYAIALFFSLPTTMENNVRGGAFSPILLVLLLGFYVGGTIGSESQDIFRNTEVILFKSELQKSPEYILRTIRWYGMNITSLDMICLSLGFAAFWMFAGTWRNLRKSLQYKDAPWVWIAFLVAISAFLSGFTFKMGLDKETRSILQYTGWPIFVSLLTLAICCLKECKEIILYKAWAKAWSIKNYTEIFRLTPLWIFSALFFVACSLATFYQAKDSEMATAILLSIFGYMIRDILVFHMIGWTLSIRRTGLGILVYLVLAYVLLPILAGISGNKESSLLFYPVITPLAEIPSQELYWVLLLVEITMAAAMFRTRWKTAFGKNQSPNAS